MSKSTSTFLADGGNHLAAVSAKNDQACWSTVLEKAVMKWNYIFQANPDIYGIGSEHTTPLFTGVGDSFCFDRGVVDTQSNHTSHHRFPRLWKVHHGRVW